MAIVWGSLPWEQLIGAVLIAVLSWFSGVFLPPGKNLNVPKDPGSLGG